MLIIYNLLVLTFVFSCIYLGMVIGDEELHEKKSALKELKFSLNLIVYNSLIQGKGANHPKQIEWLQHGREQVAKLTAEVKALQSPLRYVKIIIGIDT